MGDRYISKRKCPVCGVMYEVYDAPSSMMYCASCDNCGFSENLSYYEFKVGEQYTTCLIPTALRDYIERLETQLDEIRGMVGEY